MDKTTNDVAPLSRQASDSMQNSVAELQRLRRINLMIDRLFRSYPKTDYDDPEYARASMLVVLKRFPEDVVAELTSPETGLQRTCKFPPRLAELVCAGEEILARRAKHERYRNWGKNYPDSKYGATHNGEIVPEARERIRKGFEELAARLRAGPV